jgi:hypothetical protein
MALIGKANRLLAELAMSDVIPPCSLELDGDDLLLMHTLTEECLLVGSGDIEDGLARICVTLEELKARDDDTPPQFKNSVNDARA